MRRVSISRSQAMIWFQLATLWDAKFLSHLRNSPGYQAADAFLNGLFWTRREALVSQEQIFAVIVGTFRFSSIDLAYRPAWH